MAKVKARKRSRKPRPFAIDVHSHIDVPEAAARVAKLPQPAGAPGFNIRERPEEQARIDEAQRPLRRDPKARIAALDQLGIDLQAVNFNLSPTVYRADPGEALEIARIGNEGVADFVSRAPDRFVGFCSVPLQDAALAAKELERGVRELRLKGAWIISNVRGRELGEKDFHPFWAKAQELDVPVFIHPIGFTSPERMQRAMLWNSIGQPLEEALAMSSLIYDGVMDAFPELKVAVCHGGGYLPYYIGRHDWIYGYRSEVSDRVKGPPSSYLPRFFYDSVIFDRDMLELLVKKAGVSQIMMGADFPYTAPDPVGFIWKSRTLSQAAKEKILWRNAAKLLKLSI